MKKPTARAQQYEAPPCGLDELAPGICAPLVITIILKQLFEFSQWQEALLFSKMPGQTLWCPGPRSIGIVVFSRD
jgi:hypothetical protein